MMLIFVCAFVGSAIVYIRILHGLRLVSVFMVIDVQDSAFMYSAEDACSRTS